MLIGYARCSTDAQDLTAQRDALTALGVQPARVYTDHGCSMSSLIRMRTREGMKVARAKGRLRGKQPKLKPTQEAHLVELWRAGQHTSAELFSVARSTIYRAVQRADEPTSAT
jgi:DNA invertase Pin-like site-specific DNA recombinase